MCKRVCTLSPSVNVRSSVYILSLLSHLLYSGASDKTIKVWSVKTLTMITSFIAHEDPVCTLAASSSMLFSGSLRSIKVCHYKLTLLLQLLLSAGLGLDYT